MSESFVLEDARQGASPARDEDRRVFIRSFGCQMNVYDAERMADIAAEEGFREAHTVDDADLIVLNTCHIRERASEKIYSELGKLRELKDERRRAGRGTTLVVAGCLAQAEGAEILRRQPAVDVVVGPQSIIACLSSCAKRAFGLASSPPTSRPRTSSAISSRLRPMRFAVAALRRS